MAKEFSALLDKMPPERRARIDARVRDLEAEMPLDELREARQFTQEHLAKILKVRQAAVSKLERRADMYLSTLEKFVEAMGGELQIRAIFPEGAVNIRRLTETARRKPLRKKSKRVAERARVA
jgi:transcriptional regulator with XRE-family HTH domain